MVQNLPEEMKKFDSWVLVRMQKKDDKLIKLPFQINGSLAKVNDKSTWNTYNVTVDKIGGKNKGIGFVLSKNDPYVFIDIDKIDVKASVKQKFISENKTYTEKSQSGKGYHLIYKLDNKKAFMFLAKELELIGYGTSAKDTLAAKKGDFEIYIEKRYFWLTGDIVSNSEIKTISPMALIEIFKFIDNKGMKKAESSNSKPPAQNKDQNQLLFSDAQVLKMCFSAKNSEKFKELYHEPGVDGGSERDSALMCIIAYYTQDVKQICRIVHDSPRYREKFDTHPTYLERTAVRAIETLNGKFYNPRHRYVKSVLRQGAILPEYMEELPWIEVKFNKEGEKKIKILPAILAKYLVKPKDYINVLYPNNKKIKHMYKDKLYKKVYPEDMNVDISRYIPAEIINSRAVDETRKIMDYSDIGVREDRLNPEHLIKFRNGILNLKTDRLEPDSKHSYLTIGLKCDYRPGLQIKNSVFDRFMDTLTKGNKDVQRLIKQFMAVSISNVHGYRPKKALFMTGPGDSGKSILKLLLSKLIGIENTNSCDLSELEARFGTENIYGKRCIGSYDMGFMNVKELKRFKTITSGDNIVFEFKHENTFTSKYTGTVWFCCNDLPQFGGDKNAWVYERMMIVKCDNVIPLEKRDPYLVDKLYAEREYIINSLITYLKEFISNGYKYDIPQECLDHREEYEVNNCTVLTFIRECTEPTKDNINKEVKTSTVYKIYKAWCKEHSRNGYTETRIEFKKRLEQKGLDRITKQQGYRYYKKFVVIKEILEEYALDI